MDKTDEQLMPVKFEIPNLANIFYELKSMYMHLKSIKLNYIAIEDETEELNEKLKEAKSLLENIDYDLYHDLYIGFSSISKLLRILEEIKDIINSVLGGIVFYK